MTSQIDFELHPTVDAVRQFVHQFAETKLRPLAREADEKGHLPAETIKELAQFAGNRASVMPETSGGDPSEKIGSMMAGVGSEEPAWGDPALLSNIPRPQ